VIFSDKLNDEIQSEIDKCVEEKEKLQLLKDQAAKPLVTMLQFDGLCFDDPIYEYGDKCTSFCESRELRNSAKYNPVRIYINPDIKKELVADLLDSVYRLICKEYLYQNESNLKIPKKHESGLGSLSDDIPFK
jgi:hypothetical protein